MADRRRSPRVVFSAPQPAYVRTVHEAVVERLKVDQAEVLTTRPTAIGERFVLQFRSASGELTAHAARVLSSVPMTRDDVVRWQLVLSLSPVADPAGSR